jgi:hypothetical protein
MKATVIARSHLNATGDEAIPVFAETVAGIGKELK